MSIIKKAVAAAAIATLLAGCAVQKHMVPTSGSKADGTVVMSFEYGLFEKPQVDGNEAAAAAAQRCRAWGYSNAEAFGGYSRTCTQASQNGCLSFRVDQSFQCTGGANQ